MGWKRARRDGENSETDTWLDFALDCGYIEQSDHLHLTTECKEIGSMLGSMLKKPGTFLLFKSDIPPGRRPLWAGG